MLAPADIRTYQARITYYSGDAGPWYEHLVEDEGLTLAEARDVISNFELYPCVVEGVGHVATIIKRNKEIHIAIYRRFRGKNHVTRAWLRRMLEPMMQKECVLCTKFGPGEDSSFAERVGFEQVGVTIDGVRTFLMTRFRAARTQNDNYRDDFRQRCVGRSNQT